jgi:tetratricopeptide (TPR) repeat protein
MDPQLTQAWLVLSEIREARGDAAGTEAALTAAIAASPGSIDLLLARAGFEARRQRTDDALAWYRRALALDANRADAWLGMSIAAVYGQRPELALDYAEKARALAADEPRSAGGQGHGACASGPASGSKGGGGARPRPGTRLAIAGGTRAPAGPAVSARFIRLRLLAAQQHSML